MTAIISLGKRPYVSSKGMYGEVTRTNMLGLTDAPVLDMDDSTLTGFAGMVAKEDLYDAATKKNTLDELIASVPMDVRKIGRVQLTAHGVSDEVQRAMFRNFMLHLTVQQRAAYAAQWVAANATHDPVQIQAFLDTMVAALMAFGA